MRPCQGRETGPIPVTRSKEVLSKDRAFLLFYKRIDIVITMYYSTIRLYLLPIMMTQIQIRIDEKTKKDAQKILSTIGLDLSSAIKVYLKQVVIHKGIPLQLLTENGLTLAEERAILRASGEARTGKNITATKDWEETKEYLDSLK